MTIGCERLFSVGKIREIERLAVVKNNFSESELMERAGAAAFEAIVTFYPQCTRIAVFCGGGNNGGDGFVVARLARLQGFDVDGYLLKKNVEQLSELNRSKVLLAEEAGVNWQVYDGEQDIEADVIVDAIVGIGVRGNIKGEAAVAINAINESKVPVIAIDCPSGLNADTGQALGACVNAALTVTFIGVKQGMLTADGVDNCGRLICDELGLSELVEATEPSVKCLPEVALTEALPPRKFNSHKNKFGHVVVIGGGPGMPGAVCLAASACLRVGAGLVTVATHPEHAAMIPFYQAELMSQAIASHEMLIPLLDSATVCVLGPGLGQNPWAKAVFKQAIASHLPMVIDASALHLLTAHPQQDDNWVLTPHPGEAAALLKTDVASVQANRFLAARQLQQQYGGVAVLKGAGSVIATQFGLEMCPFGNPAMSSPGMGDVLSGILAGLIAQGLNLEQAASVGVSLHALAGDKAADKKHCILASDLLSFL